MADTEVKDPPATVGTKDEKTTELNGNAHSKQAVDEKTTETKNEEVKNGDDLDKKTDDKKDEEASKNSDDGAERSGRKRSRSHSRSSSRSRSRSRSYSRSDSGSRSRSRSPYRENRRNGRGRGYKNDNRNQRGGFKTKYQKRNNKFDPSSAKETDDPVEIRKQVEFYFSDANLPNDKFLFEQVGGSTNNAVLISTIHSFKRMRRFQPFEAVVAALKESSTLDVVEDDTKIQRKVALPEGTGSTQPEIQKVFETGAMARSVYVKGFGREESSSQFDIENWFSQFGHTNQVRLRRANDGGFKGSVFVEFDSEDTAKNFLELDPKPEYNGKALLIKSKKQYCDEKVDDINAGAIRAGEPDERDWKARRDQDRKQGFPDRNGRNGRGGRGGRGRGGRGGGRYNDDRRDRRDRDLDRDDPRDKREKKDDAEGKEEEDDKKEDQSETKADGDKKETQAEVKPADDTTEATESKKRERDDDQEEVPVAKKTAVESEFTGAPESAKETKTEA